LHKGGLANKWLCRNIPGKSLQIWQHLILHKDVHEKTFFVKSCPYKKWSLQIAGIAKVGLQKAGLAKMWLAKSCPYKKLVLKKLHL